jgi:CAAX prenyl protease-like protein
MSHRRRLLERHAWLVFVLPLVVFLLGTQIEPKPAADGQPGEPGSFFGIGAIPYECYPLVYSIKIALTVAAVAFVAPGYRAFFPPRVSFVAVVVGVVGGALWVALCNLELERRIGEWLAVDWLIDLGRRSAFNPLVELADKPLWAYGFLAIRLVGLVLVVPLIEEFFLRGFLMRFITHPNWQHVPLGGVSRSALVAGTLVPMLMHPAELFAAAVWFSLVTWLMLRTKSISDCILAHALTNLVLGAWVIASGQWRLL